VEGRLPEMILDGRGWRPAQRILLPLAALSLLAGCANYTPVATMPRDTAAFALMDQLASSADAAPYRVGPDDVLRINVFFEPEMSTDSIKVDRSGQIAVPGIGPLTVEGMTTTELSGNIADLLRSGGLLRDPRVAVSIVSSATRKVIVTGEVKQSGVYDLRGDATLLEAVAMARDETDIAALDEVVIFRVVNGQRMAGRFDIGAIRSGAAENPRILENDLVVVGSSAVRVLWRDIRQTIPLLGLFIRISD
jgi:polysaccharide export outer membrane protein